MIEKTIGTRLENVRYFDRIGSYAVVFDHDDEIAVVRKSNGYFLIGGGLENEETHEECIRRECLEETGYQIAVRGFFCKSDMFYQDSFGAWHPIGFFYNAKLGEKVQEPTELNHKLIWLPVREAIGQMFFKHQSWVIEQAFKKFKNGKE